MHPARQVAFRHLLMNDAAPRRHPLHLPGSDRAVVAHAVAVLHGPRQDVSNGFDPAVGVPRKSCQVIRRDVIAEVVEKQKRVEVRSVAEPERATQVHARTFQRRLGFNQALNRSKGHV